MSLIRPRFAEPARLSRHLGVYLAWEALMTERCNRIHRVRALRLVFALASRLGDGVGWYGLALLVLAVHGWVAVEPMLVMLFSGAIGVMVYLTIKRCTGRLRPLHRNERIEVSVAPLDQYSFPSGHTLHATNFGIQLLAFEPLLAPLVVPFALLVAVSRMVLGLHYLSDVLVGAAIGASIALVSLSLF